MSNLASSIVLGASLLASGCTVHHHHHHAPSNHAQKSESDKGMGMHGHHGKAHDNRMCGQALPEGHPPVMGPHHGKRAHGMDPHHGKRAHGMDPHHGSEAPPTTVHHDGASGDEAPGHDHQSMHAMPAAVQSFHDAFAAAWHLESEDDRRKTACAEIATWKQLAGPVKAHKPEGASAPAYASAADDLGRKLNVVGFACNRKKGDVQGALKGTHDALHALFKALQAE